MFISPLIQFGFQLYQEQNQIPPLIEHRKKCRGPTGYKHHAPTALEDLFMTIPF
jgi:hypothetical protein